MRFHSGPRLLAALVALTTALASPVVALAHGVAHEHESHHTARSMSSSVERADDPAVEAETAPEAEHAVLHARCGAKVQPVVAVPASASAPLIASAPRRIERAGTPSSLDVPVTESTPPPDQPRAPPLG